MPKKTLYTGVAVTVTLLVVGFFFILGVPFDNSAINSQVSGSAQASQLAVQDVVVGTGPGAQPGDVVVVNYTGRLGDGTVFDSSAGRQSYSFTLGAGQVIPGWDQGVVGVQVGTKRLLIVPPDLAYGPQDYGPIPGNSTLVFEIDVISITPGPSVPNLQTQ